MLGGGEVLNPVSEGGKCSSFLGTEQSVPKAFQGGHYDQALGAAWNCNQSRKRIVHQGAITRKWQDELLKR